MARILKRWSAAALLAVLAATFLSTTAGALPRYGHTATMLPNRNVLICGGFDSSEVPTITTGTILNTCVISDENDGGAVSNAAKMTTGRSSHTAVLLPNGNVLVAGGWNGAAVLNSAQVYDPVANTWAAEIFMNSARMHHTATLLKTGKVLICGGQTTDASVSLDTCELYDPTANNFTATVNTMQTQRARHTAVLLRNGRVWLAGGFNSGYTPPYIVTTEVYDPATDSFLATRSLITARADHSATMMGDGRILVAGGLNNKNLLENKGYLDTAEIYDPVSDNIVPAARMKYRTSRHSAAVMPSGEVALYGGLGNITTTFVTAYQSAMEGGFVTGAFLGTTTMPLKYARITGGSLQISNEISLGQEIAGRVHGGDVFFSSPSISFAGGTIFMPPGSSTATDSGLRFMLNGADVDCYLNSSDVLDCGRIRRTFDSTTIPNVQGYYYTPPLSVSVEQFQISGADQSSIIYFGGNLSEGTNVLSISSGIVTGTTRIRGLPLSFVGAQISSGVMRLSDGAFVQNSSWSVQIIRAELSIPAGTDILADDGVTAATELFPTTMFISEGVITWEGGSADQVFPSTATTPRLNTLGSLIRPTVTGAGELHITPDRITLTAADGDDMLTDATITTITIREMSFADMQVYKPFDGETPANTNTWSVEHGEYSMTDTLAPSFSHTGYVNSQGFFKMHGGRTCTNAICTQVGARAATIPYMTIAPRAWIDVAAQLTTARGNHTSTLLPDGKILIAGGTNGPNVLSTAQLYDPTSLTLTSVGSMHTARDLHSATLLPNGRVLVAGGFATTTTSSGATKTSEIYYPDVRLWLRTGDMNEARSNHSTVLLPDGNVLAIGGYRDGVYLRTMEIYYSTAGVWRYFGPSEAQGGSLPQRRAQHTATLLPNGEVFVVGGINGAGILGSTLLINTSVYAAPVAGPVLPGGLHSHSHSATQIGNGYTVMVAGGNDEFGELANSQIYNRLTNSWTVTEELDEPRLAHTGTLLPDGSVLLTGGFNAAGVPVSLDEKYSPSLDEWATLGALNDPRGYHTVTVDGDGGHHIIGGYDGAQYMRGIERNRYAFEDLFAAGGSGTRRPVVSTMSATLLDRNLQVTFTGSGLLGNSEGNAGNSGSMSSVQYLPRVLLQRIEGSNGTGAQGSSGFNLDLSTYIFAAGANTWSNVDTSIRVTLPAAEGSVPYGWYAARIGNNGVYSPALIVPAGPPKPTTGVTMPTAPVSVDTGTVAFLWNPPASGSFDGYNVYNATTGVLMTMLPITTPDNSCAPYPCFLQRNLIANGTAAIAIAPYNRSGDGPVFYSTASTSGRFWFTRATTVTLTATDVTADSVKLNWQHYGNRDGTRYELEQSPDNFTTIVTTPVPRSFAYSATYYTVTALAPNTQYHFRVRAYNDNDEPTAYSNTASILTKVTIAALGGVAESSATIRWAWSQPGNPGVANSWKVYNATTGVLLANVSSTTYLQSGLDPNIPVSIQVAAIDVLAQEGPLSSTVTVWTLARPPLPNPPGILLSYTSGFVVTWSDPGNPPGTRYVVKVSSIIGVHPTTGALLFETGESSKTAIGTNQQGMFELFNPGEVWETRVYAANNDPTRETGFLSATYLPIGMNYTRTGTTITVQVVPTWAEDPQNFRVTAQSPSSISLAWDTNTNTSSVTYQVVYSTDNFSLHSVTAIPYSAGFSGSAVTISGLASSQVYQFRLRARNLEGVEATPPTPDIAAPTTSGGADPGALGGEVSPNETTAITGTIGLAPSRPVTVIFPAGTFSAPVQMRLSTQSVAGNDICAAPGVSTTTLAVSLTVSPALQPNRKIILRVGYQDSDIGALPPARVNLLRHEPAFGKCVPAIASVDTQNKLITGELNHLSVYQVGSIEPASAVGGVRVFPNPWYSSRLSHVTIHQLPADAKVKIFTVRGELVRELTPNASGLAIWDGLNRGGRHVASGVYLMMVESGGDRKITKLAVLR